MHCFVNCSERGQGHLRKDNRDEVQNFTFSYLCTTAPQTSTAVCCRDIIHGKVKGGGDQLKAHIQQPNSSETVDKFLSQKGDNTIASQHHQGHKQQGKENAHANCYQLSLPQTQLNPQRWWCAPAGLVTRMSLNCGFMMRASRRLVMSVTCRVRWGSHCGSEEWSLLRMFLCKPVCLLLWFMRVPWEGIWHLTRWQWNDRLKGGIPWVKLEYFCKSQIMKYLEVATNIDSCLEMLQKPVHHCMRLQRWLYYASVLSL